MYRALNKVLLVAASFLFLGGAGLLFAQAKADPAAVAGGAEDLNARLIKVREEIVKATADTERKSKELNRYEHDVVYTNKEISKLYQDIVKLEKEILKKRTIIGELVSVTPDGLEKNKAWRDARQRLDALRQEESILLKKISTVGVQGGSAGK